MLLEVKGELLAETKLQKVVVERFFADLNLLGSVFESVANDLVVLVRDSVVKFAPERNFLDDILNCALLSSLLLRGSICVRIVHDVARFLGG